MSGIIQPIGIGYAQQYTRLTSAGIPLNMRVSPGSTNAPVIFEPPLPLTGGLNEIWVVATGASAEWGGAQVWISSDGNTYAFAGNIYAGARQGVLTAALPVGSDPDLTDTLAVDLTMSLGQLLSGTQADADGLVTLCYCDGELVSYETATLTAAYKYSLTYLRRGAYGTVIGAHAAGSQFARFGPNDPSVFKYAYPPGYTGRTLYLKLPAFNLYGSAQQSLAAVEATPFTLLGTGSVASANNTVIANLAAGVTPEDWGSVAAPVTLTADFGTLALAPGLDIDLGTPF